MLLYIDNEDSELIIKSIQYYGITHNLSEDYNERGDKIIERINEIK